MTAAEFGANSDGLRITQLPAAIAPTNGVNVTVNG